MQIWTILLKDLKDIGYKISQLFQCFSPFPFNLSELFDPFFRKRVAQFYLLIDIIFHSYFLSLSILNFRSYLLLIIKQQKFIISTFNFPILISTTLFILDERRFYLNNNLFKLLNHLILFLYLWANSILTEKCLKNFWGALGFVVNFTQNFVCLQTKILQYYLHYRHWFLLIDQVPQVFNET